MKLLINADQYATSGLCNFYKWFNTSPVDVSDTSVNFMSNFIKILITYDESSALSVTGGPQIVANF